MARIPVTKTPKVYVGGQFIRSESGRVFPVREAGSRKREAGLLGNIPQCTRKDLRNAVEAAAKAGPDQPLHSSFVSAPAQIETVFLTELSEPELEALLDLMEREPNTTISPSRPVSV